MKDKKGTTIWVEEVVGHLRELSELPTEEHDAGGVCAALELFDFDHGDQIKGAYELVRYFREMFSAFSGDPVFPVGGIEEFDKGDDRGTLWDNELRREYALEMADRIEEAWEAAA